MDFGGSLAKDWGWGWGGLVRGRDGFRLGLSINAAFGAEAGAGGEMARQEARHLGTYGAQA